MNGFVAYEALNLPPLPVDACLHELCSVLSDQNRAVLVAPPGAGKTSRVPLALLNAPWNANKKLIVLEPRRLAARAAAEHMASLMGEPVGKTVGYKVRMDNQTGPQTRIEFVTEGVFTRMVLDDPELTGIGGILFDEYHERSLEADLGLALALDVQISLREDLRILPMSATLDGAAVSQMMDQCRIIESEGRTFPVDIRYRPSRPDSRIENEMSAAIKDALRKEDGDLLCFLPGQGEIRRVTDRLDGLADNVDLHMLFGAMKPEDQRLAIAPAKQGKRKVVLATAIAQTSLTLEGVRIVIDSGLARVPRHEPATGLTRLTTVRASKATIAQRAGRAGRTQPGIAIRLWHEGQNAALPDQDRPEILEAELSKLVLDLASWGVSNPVKLNWLDHPPKPTWEQALKTLIDLGALDEAGLITPSGRQLRDMPLTPRLGHMVLASKPLGVAEKAARLALLISERGIGGNDIDLAVRLQNIERTADPRSKKLKASARSIAAGVSGNPSGKVADISPGLLLSFAWPERIAKRMGVGPNGEVSYLMANGRRAQLDGISSLAKAEWLVVSDVQGSAANGRILGASATTEEAIISFHESRIESAREVTLDKKTGVFQAFETRRLGAITLNRHRVKLAKDADVCALVLDYLQQEGLGAYLSGKKSSYFLERLSFLHQHYSDRFKPADEATLLTEIQSWLAPMLHDVKGPGDLTDEKMLEALKHFAGYEKLREIDRLAPARWTLPTGNAHAIEYKDGTATLKARVQEFFGLKSHPSIGEGDVPLALELLSPAMRPLQKTLDIVGFWEGSWQDVRKDMRGRYPKHVWPEDPANAAATSRAKPRSK